MFFDGECVSDRREFCEYVVFDLGMRTGDESAWKRLELSLFWVKCFVKEAGMLFVFVEGREMKG